MSLRAARGVAIPRSGAGIPLTALPAALSVMASLRKLARPELELLYGFTIKLHKSHYPKPLIKHHIGC